MLGTHLFFHQKPGKEQDFLAQNTNTYLGPTGKIPGNPKLIMMQIIVNDSPDPTGVQISSVEFNRQNIPLQPRDIHGFRGQASFQIPPGKYKLKWVVQQNEIAWPRTVPHEADVIVNPKDLWLQITITGDEANIT